MSNPNCDHGAIRLLGGETELDGRVEVCVGGRWGTVCDDLWGAEDASVVCSQLGYSRKDAVPRERSFYGSGSGPIFFDETRCFGNESRLVDCLSSGIAVHNCFHTEDAGVTCQRELNCVFCTLPLKGLFYSKGSK